MRTLALLLVAAGALLPAACKAPPPRVAVGEHAPAFAAPRLDGSTLALEDLRGSVVLLNVWATWCYPCRKEMPAFEEVYRELADAGVRIVAVSIDATTATGAVREFIEEFDLSFDIVLDPAQRVTRTYQTIGVPETFLIGADGRLRRHWLGRIDPRTGAVRAEILAALKDAAETGRGREIRAAR